MPAPLEVQQSIVYWVGYVEEANRDIDWLSKKQGQPFKDRLKIVKQKRDEGLKKIAELGGSADFIKQLFG